MTQEAVFLGIGVSIGIATLFLSKYFNNRDNVRILEGQFRKDIGSKKLYLDLKAAIKKSERSKRLTITFFTLAGILGVVYCVRGV
jgi:hypothetical protein